MISAGKVMWRYGAPLGEGTRPGQRPRPEPYLRKTLLQNRPRARYATASGSRTICEREQGRGRRASTRLDGLQRRTSTTTMSRRYSRRAERHRHRLRRRLFRGVVGFDPKPGAHMAPSAVLAQLDVAYEDGRMRPPDRCSWRCSRQPDPLLDLSGASLRRPKEMPGGPAGFDDSGWYGVEVGSRGHNLVAQQDEGSG